MSVDVFEGFWTADDKICIAGAGEGEVYIAVSDERPFYLTLNEAAALLDVLKRAISQASDETPAELSSIVCDHQPEEEVGF